MECDVRYSDAALYNVFLHHRVFVTAERRQHRQQKQRNGFHLFSFLLNPIIATGELPSKNQKFSYPDTTWIHYMATIGL
jgi:hypothetical protein